MQAIEQTIADKSTIYNRFLNMKLANLFSEMDAYKDDEVDDIKQSIIYKVKEFIKEYCITSRIVIELDNNDVSSIYYTYKTIKGKLDNVNCDALKLHTTSSVWLWSDGSQYSLELVLTPEGVYLKLYSYGEDWWSSEIVTLNDLRIKTFTDELSQKVFSPVLKILESIIHKEVAILLLDNTKSNDSIEETNQ